MIGRWDTYLVAETAAEFQELYAAACSEGEGPVLLALGTGFDPRSLHALEQVLSAGRNGRLHLAHIELPGATESADSEVVTMAVKNQERFRELSLEDTVHNVPFPDVYDRMTAGPRIGTDLVGLAEEIDASVVIVDVSSLPSTIYFPALRSLLAASDGGTHSFELLAVASENPDMDALIIGQGVEDAELVGGFRSGLAETDPFAVNPTLWVPVVGEGSEEELERIHNRLAPKETVPVLPFPSRNPRRPDSILLEHWPTLVDRFLATPHDIVVSDERTPFDVYRTVCSIAASYRVTLTEPLGGINVIVSTHSSKTMALGVFLAAYDQNLGVIAAPRSDYAVADAMLLESLASQSHLVTAWLAGAPYSL